MFIACFAERFGVVASEQGKGVVPGRCCRGGLMLSWGLGMRSSGSEVPAAALALARTRQLPQAVHGRKSYTAVSEQD